MFNWGNALFGHQLLLGSKVIKIKINMKYNIFRVAQCKHVTDDACIIHVSIHGLTYKMLQISVLFRF